MASKCTGILTSVGPKDLVKLLNLTFLFKLSFCCLVTFKAYQYAKYVVRTSPFFKRGRVNFKYLSRRGEFRNIQKRRWKYGAVALFLFNFEFFQGLSFLHLAISSLFAILYYAFEEKLFFSSTIILWKKVILNCLKTNLKMSHKLW